MIEVQNVIPRWIHELMQEVDQCVQPEVPLFSLGYQWMRLRPDDPTTIKVYPLPGAFEGASRLDGCHMTPGYGINVMALGKKFNRVDGLGFRSPTCYTSDSGDDGPEFRISGSYQNRSIILRILSQPPPGVQPSMLVHVDTGAFRPRVETG
jgi:hypothetical protein